MNKKGLIENIYEKTGIDRTVISEVIREAHEIIIRELSKGDSVKISGFGTFHTVDREAKKGRNPKTGETIHIPPKRVPKFRPGKPMKDSVRG